MVARGSPVARKGVVEFSASRGLSVPVLNPIDAGAEGSWSGRDDGDGYANIGDEIQCTYEIKNTGTQTLSGLCVVDHNVGTDCVEFMHGKASPGEAFVISTTHKVRREPIVRLIVEGEREQDRWSGDIYIAPGWPTGVLSAMWVESRTPVRNPADDAQKHYGSSPNGSKSL